MKFLFVVLIATTGVLYGQDTEFPNGWIGKYAGDMVIANANRPNDTVAVEFTMKELIKDSLWTDNMHYFSEKWGNIEKNYLIRAVSRENKVDFQLDEQNGIIMELTLMNECFYGMYEVMGMIYTSTLRKHGDQLFFELYAAPLENPTISETEADENGESITVESPKPILTQSVVLTRME